MQKMWSVFPFRPQTVIIFVLILLFSFIACDKNHTNDKNKSEKNDTILVNSKSKIANKSVPPVIVLLDNCPKPRIVVIPKVAGGCYTFTTEKGIKKIDLKPPVINRLPIVSRTVNGAEEPDQAAACVGFFTTYNTEQGLALSSISYGNKSAICDRLGNLWFGTQGGGVSRYDGKSFFNFTTAQGLANNIVVCIAEDRKGNYWFGTDGGGVSRYDGKSFTNYTTVQGLANNSVLTIAEDKTGNLWFGTFNGGVSRYDGKTFTNFTTAQGLANDTVISIGEDKSGNLWFGTDGGGVSRFDGKTFTNYTTAQGLANNNVRNITVDKSGNLWFGTSGGGVSCYN